MGSRAENKDFRLIGHLCASRFPSMVYCSFMPGQITNLTRQKAILFGICPMAACYFQLWGRVIKVRRDRVRGRIECMKERRVERVVEKGIRGREKQGRQAR